MKGYIHVYTGNGKGKTTAAFGLALRAAGAGKRVFIAQFVKGKMYSEIKAVRKYLPTVKVCQYGLRCFIKDKPHKEDILAAQKGLAEIASIIREGTYDMIILDEANIALYYHLFTEEDLIGLINLRKDSTEIVITGRYAPKKILEIADLVTEMKEIIHYYTKGVQAREGIEF